MCCYYQIVSVSVDLYDVQTLKQIKFDGGKVDIYKGQGKNISVCPKDTSLSKYKNYGFIGAFEQEFFSIEYI